MRDVATRRRVLSGDGSSGIPWTLLVAGAAVFSFLGAGGDVLLCPPLALAFGFVAGGSLARRTSAPATADVHARLVFALAAAFGATWLGVAWNVECFDWGRPQDLPAWRASHGASAWHYETLMVSGFPLQRVEGHGGGGAFEYLPAAKGLWVLVANLGLWTIGFIVVALALPRRLVFHAAWTAVVLAPVCCAVGFERLMYMLD